jgi:hypothetical protein
VVRQNFMVVPCNLSELLTWWWPVRKRSEGVGTHVLVNGILLMTYFLQLDSPSWRIHHLPTAPPSGDQVFNIWPFWRHLRSKL